MIHFISKNQININYSRKWMIIRDIVRLCLGCNDFYMASVLVLMYVASFREERHIISTHVDEHSLRTQIYAQRHIQRERKKFHLIYTQCNRPISRFEKSISYIK